MCFNNKILSRFIFRKLFAALIIYSALLSSHALNFNCEFKLSKLFGRILHYKCLVGDLNLESKGQSLSGVKGDHQENLTNNEVGVLFIENQTCLYLPSDVNNFFPNIYHLEIKNSKLKEITVDDLKMFANLKNLYLKSNAIEIIPEKLFEFNIKLQFINFNDNKIKRIASNIFENIPEIVSFSVERNICIDDSAYGADDLSRLKNEILRNCE